MSEIYSKSTIKLPVNCYYFFLTYLTPFSRVSIAVFNAWSFCEEILSKYTFFYKQLHFLLQPRVTYSRMNFEPGSCLAFACSIHFQPLVTWELLIFNKFMLNSFASIGGRSFISGSSLTSLAANFQETVLFYMSLSSVCLFSNNMVPC